MGGGYEAPAETAADIELKRQQSAYYQAQIDAANRPVVIPEIKAADPLPPSPTESSADVADAADEARRKAAKRTNTARGTLFGGETGGYGSQRQTLLG